MTPNELLVYLSRFLDALHCGAVILERSGVILFANMRLRKMMRRDADGLIGRNLLDIYHDDDGRAFVKSLLEHFDEPQESEFYLPLPDGARLPVVASGRVLNGQSPLNDWRIATIIDISPQKAAEQNLKDQYKTIAELSNTVFSQAEKLNNYSHELEDRVRRRTQQLHDAHMDAIYMLAVASEAKDADTGAHVRRIQRYTELLARKIGLPDAQVELIGPASILHDVGKIHVPDEILKKPGPLDDDERRIMQEHTIAGERILSNRPFFESARRIARSHHENFDGTGYPDGLVSDAIPIEARIVHLADVFDALTNPRVYKKAWPSFNAAAVLREARGTMFDPDIVRAFEDLYAAGEFENR
jgi:putative nucleotidyltransferase with HDIG domain/PAS domain S-box-containing protein